MAKAKKPASHYDKCEAEWERRKAERKAQFAEAQAARGKPDDGPDDWKPGARFVTPDPVMSAASGGDWLVDKPELALNAGPFLATLLGLFYQTQDSQFLDLHRKLLASGLVKNGKWSYSALVLANPLTLDMCEMIEQSLATKVFVSEREAIADAVVELGLDAASFRAACERVRLLLNAYREAVAQKTR